MTGTVVTFYSYKGGVGRSFALANIAVLLGRWGLRVLCIDWDLEAPGLPQYFSTLSSETSASPFIDEKAPGLVESFTDFQLEPKKPLAWNDRIILLSSTFTPGLSLLKAGCMDSTYTERLHDLDWRQLYSSGLGEALDELFDSLRNEYDFILIDARTGVTDFSGIINSQLPDILAFLFTSNEQSFEGAKNVARRAVNERNRLPIDRSRLFLLPIPARFEVQLENRLSTSWQARFTEELKEFYEAWTSPSSNHEQLVQLTTIPYVPIWSFGERLAVVEDSSTDPLSINYSLETIAALLAHRLDQTLLLLDSRDEFVSSARRVAQQHDPTSYSVFLSHLHEDSETAAALAKHLEQKGLRTFRPQVAEGAEFSRKLREIVNRATHMMLLLGVASKHSRQQEYEARTFLRQAASDEKTRLLIPVALYDADAKSIPMFLRQYNLIRFLGDYEATANEVTELIRSTVIPDDRSRPGLSVNATTDGNIPIEGLSLCALADNGTTITGVTDRDGKSSLDLLENRTYRLLIAHPKYASKIVEGVHADDDVPVRMPLSRGVGSVIIHSTGYIPGLNGRLNPILDTSNRTYLYADNIAVSGGQQQPATFGFGKPFDLEDAHGNNFEVTVKLISGRTSLLEYRKRP